MRVEAKRGRKRQGWIEYLALPELQRDEAWFESAFLELSAQRGMGFSGPEALKFTEIESYLRLADVTSYDSRREALTILLALDRDYLNDLRRAQD